ncbi:ras and EF-hand domain-containing protein homolog isoform X2 [Amphiura filiformis]|uniref:ras and EF-hand domain-containing protein homolog isoform X2 n=1 Tax=Amphiura filiformis TaxID=82378 RepID=UPI003B2100A6
MDEARVQQLFNACDLNRSGFIEPEDLENLCADLDLEPQELDDVFQELDKNRDGKISATEFVKGYESVQRMFTRPRKSSGRDSVTNGRIAWDAFTTQMGSNIYILPSQEQISDLYQQLHSSDVPQLLNQFESIVFDVIKDIRQQQTEIDRLEKSLKKTNETHTEHLKQLEDEMEVQTTKAEQRVRKEEKEKNEVEKEELKANLEAEIQQLQTNLNKFQSFEKKWLDRDKKDDVVQNLRKQLDELTIENRSLKSQLTEAQTNLTLARSELVAVKAEYDDQIGFMDTEKTPMQDFIQEQQNLNRQVQLLQDANRKLQDTNDELRAQVDYHRKSSQPPKSRSTTPTRRPSLQMLEYMDEVAAEANAFDRDYHRKQRSRYNSQNSHESDLSVMSGIPRRQFVYHQTTVDGDYPDDVDSGNSTLRDPLELDSELEAHGIIFDDFHQSTRRTPDYHQLSRKTPPPVTEKLVTQMSHGDSAFKPTNPFFTSSEPSHKSPMPSNPVITAEKQTEKFHRNSSPRSSTSSTRSRKRTLPKLPSDVPRSQNAPDRMYKIVLAGDAAVGKSSLIMRLCKGIFQTNLNSTLGVDFQMKTLEVDGKVTSLQLWDTAGQERFRSIAKSYFRRADGVLLLYDVTFERSFINVRDWIEAIEDGAQKQVPIMICGNKVDLRASASADGVRCVRTEDGERLAGSFNALFCETSIKDGSNVVEAVTQLARQLQEKEDLEVEQSTLIELEKEAKKKAEGSKCCDF